MIDKDRKNDNTNYHGRQSPSMTEEQLISYLSDIYSRCLIDIESLEKDMESDLQLIDNINISDDKDKKRYKSINLNKRRLLKRIEDSKQKLDKVYKMINKI